MNSAMTSRERVFAAAKGQPVDRVPVFMFLNPHACCRMIAKYQPLKKPGLNLLARFLWQRFHKGGELKAHEIWRALPLLLDGYPFNAALEYSFQLGADMTVVGHDLLRNIRLKQGHLVIKDFYGVERSLGSGIYADGIEPVIKDVAQIKDYIFPDFRDEAGYAGIRKYRKLYPDKSICAGVCGAFDFPQASVFGIERMMVYLVDYPDEMQAFMRRWTDNEIVAVQRSVKAGADTVLIYDDYGYNNRTFLSPRMWKSCVYPHLKRLTDAVHEEGALALLHSCGYQMPLVDSYVEAGIDMLQAFQPLAGNDFAAAYEKHGDMLTFVTGIDTQRGETLSPQEYREDILKVYKIGITKPRFVLGMTHMLQFTMPLENIRVIFDTLAEIKSGNYEI